MVRSFYRLKIVVRNLQEPSGGVQRLPAICRNFPEAYGGSPQFAGTFRRGTEASRNLQEPSGGVRRLPAICRNLPEAYGGFPQLAGNLPEAYGGFPQLAGTFRRRTEAFRNLQETSGDKIYVGEISTCSHKAQDGLPHLPEGAVKDGQGEGKCAHVAEGLAHLHAEQSECAREDDHQRNEE